MYAKYYLTACLACAGLTYASAVGPAPFALAPLSSHPQTVRVEKNQRMLVLSVQGDPDRNGDSAMKVLLSHFFQGAGEEEMNAPVQPRVRWLLRAPTVPKRAWLAIYGLPISESFSEPLSRGVNVQTWKSGLVAETAYSGPYAGAQPAIDSLKAYIKRHGFALFGELEEVYVRGRGTLDQGNPSSYHTLIRIRVREVRDSPVPTFPLSSSP